MSANSSALSSSAPREPLERRQQVVDVAVERGEVHRRREDVVRRLAHVDVVVRVHVLAGEASRSPRSRSCSSSCRSRSGRRRSGTGRRARRRRSGRLPRRCAARRPRRAARGRRSTRAAAALIRPSQCATGGRDRLAGDGEVGDRLRVSPPQSSCVAGGAAHRASASAARVGPACRPFSAAGDRQSLPAARVSAGRRSSRPRRAARPTRRASRAGGRAARPRSRSCGRSTPSRRTSTTRRRARRAARRPRPPTRRGRAARQRAILEQELDRLGRVLLVRADHAARAALDPARAVDARHGAPSSPSTRPPRSASCRAPSSNGTPGDRRRRGSRRCGRRGRTGSSRVSSAVANRPPLVDELVADDLDRLDPLVAEDRDRRARKRSTSRCGLPSGSRAAYSRSTLDVAPRGRRRRLELGLARGVELELGRIDDDVRAGQLAELAQLAAS